MAVNNPQEWQGETPVFLVIRSDEGHVVAVDLDEPQWLETYKTWLRAPGWWDLRSKDGITRLRIIVRAGDQPYYTARHVGITSSGGSNEMTAFGIGKKLANGDMVRLWLLPDGSVAGGEDVDDYGVALLHELGPR